MHCSAAIGALVSVLLEFLVRSHIQFVSPHVQAPSAYLKINAMASIRKKLSMALGFNGEASPSLSKANSMDMSRGSIDSGYHSMIAKPKRGGQGGLSETATFIESGMESSPERSPRKLHKAISSTFSGAMQAFSNTVRSTTSYIYPTAGEPELPSNEWAECETPKKQSHRSSIMSSIRSRKQRFTPRSRDDKNESPELPKSPVPVTREKAPALDVEIPNPFFSYESLGESSTSRGLQLLAGVKLPAAAKNLWPGPTRMTVDQASGNDRRGTLDPASSMLDDPYIEQGDRLQHGLSFVTSVAEFALESPSPDSKKLHLSDDKGYPPEVESNADVSESDGLVPACLKYVAPRSPEARTSSPCRHKDHAAPHVHDTSSASPCQRTIPSRTSSPVPSGSKPSKSETLDGAAEKTASRHSLSRTSSHHSASLEDGLNALFPSDEDTMTSNSRSLYKRMPSDVYDADAESLESSMGSRAAWERHRADRERRYIEIIDMAPNTESDEEVGPELELKRSPSKKPVHYAEELVLGTINIEGSETTPRYPTGDLRYAVEAIERSAFPVGDLAYAVEAIERPSVTTFDPLETVFQQRPMLRLIDMIDEQGSLRVPDPQNLSPSRLDVPSSSPADLSPSQVGLPLSPEPSSVEIPAAPKYTMMTMKLTDEEVMAFGTGDPDDQSIDRFSCKSTDGSAHSSPEQQPRVAPEDASGTGLNAGGLLVPTYLSRSTMTAPLEEYAYEAGLEAAGISMPTNPSTMAQARPAMNNTYEGELKATSVFNPIFEETSHSTYPRQLETVSTLSKPQSRNGTPFEHSRKVSASSDDTDDSCAITRHGPLCNAPPPFPSLHVRSEPARHISCAIDGSATYGDEQIRIIGPANGVVNPSLPSPIDDPGDKPDEAGSKLSPSKTLEGLMSPNNYAQVTWLERHDLQSSSPGSTSKMQSPCDSNTPQEMFNAAKLPSFVSPSLAASKKARRKQKKSSSGTGTVPFAELTLSPKNIILEPDFSPTKREMNWTSALDKSQTALGESARILEGSVQKPSPNRQLGGKNRRGRDQTSLKEFTKIVGDSVRWLDPSSKSKSSRQTLGGKGQGAAAMSATSSPPRMKIIQDRDKSVSDETHEDAGNAEDSKPRLQPEFSIKHFDSMSHDPPLDANQSIGSTSYAGYELDSVVQTSPSIYCRHERGDDLQQDSDKKAAQFASDDETIGKDSESDKDASRASGQKKNDKSLLKAEKKFAAMQRELERKSDRACSRLVGKLKSGALGGDHVREGEPAHKEGRPPWRP